EERTGELSVGRQRERFAEQPVLRGIEREPDRLIIGESRSREPQDFAHGGSEQLLVSRFPVHQPRDARAKLAVELFPQPPVSRPRRPLDPKKREVWRLLAGHRVLKTGSVEGIVA